MSWVDAEPQVGNAAAWQRWENRTSHHGRVLNRTLTMSTWSSLHTVASSPTGRSSSSDRRQESQKRGIRREHHEFCGARDERVAALHRDGLADAPDEPGIPRKIAHHRRKIEVPIADVQGEQAIRCEFLTVGRDGLSRQQVRRDGIRREGVHHDHRVGVVGPLAQRHASVTDDDLEEGGQSRRKVKNVRRGRLVRPADRSRRTSRHCLAFRSKPVRRHRGPPLPPAGHR